MMGFLEAREAHSPGLAAPHRTRPSTHSRRSSLAIVLAASRRLSKAQLAGHPGLLQRRRRRRRRRRTRSPGRAGAAGWGGAPPRGPMGNAVPARAAVSGREPAVLGTQTPLLPHRLALSRPPGTPWPLPLPGGQCGENRRLLGGRGVGGSFPFHSSMEVTSVTPNGAQVLEGEPLGPGLTGSCNQAASAARERFQKSPENLVPTVAPA